MTVTDISPGAGELHDPERERLDLEAQVARLTTVVNRLDREVEALEEYIEVADDAIDTLCTVGCWTLRSLWGEKAIAPRGSAHYPYERLCKGTAMRGMTKGSRWFKPRRPDWRSGLYGPAAHVKALARAHGVDTHWNVAMSVDELRLRGVPVDRKDAVPAFDRAERKRQVRAAQARAEEARDAAEVRRRTAEREARAASERTEAAS